ncbi:MAG: hypothetical protein N3A01_01315 [Bacteroidales bacterium]|nr:hypothetical protein [Bacteroidales bacterium]
MKKHFITFIMILNFISNNAQNDTIFNIIKDDSFLIKYIYENIHWSRNLKGKTIENNIIFIADIINDSLINNIKIIKGVDVEIDTQIAELLKRYKFNFSTIPDTIKKVKIIIPIFYSRK